jgi:catechol 2,3-dioxygenase-like lactoylglutathione lyase family enzyme
MLADSKAFSGFAVPDVAEARQFYGETLGLRVGPLIAWFKDPAGNVLSILAQD